MTKLTNKWNMYLRLMVTKLWYTMVTYYHDLKPMLVVRIYGNAVTIGEITKSIEELIQLRMYCKLTLCCAIISK